MMRRSMLPAFSTATTVSLRTITQLPSVAARCQSSGGGGNDDKAELDRERQLRERFENLKKQSSSGGLSGMLGKWREQMEDMRRQAEKARTSSSSSSATGGKAPPMGAPGTAGFTFLSFFYSVFLYTTAFYSVLLVWQTGRPESTISTLQGIPWWANRAENTATAILCRVLLSVSNQREIKTQLDAHVKLYPHEGIEGLLLRSRPDLLAGYQYPAHEVVGVVAQALRGAGSECTTVVTKAARSSRDTKAQADAIVLQLRTTYPQFCGR